MKYLLFLLSIGLFSGQAAIARPWLYTSTSYGSVLYPTPAYACLSHGEDVLKEVGFTRDLKTKQYSSKSGRVQGYLRNHPVVAEIKCNESRAFRMIIVSGNNNDLTWDK